MANNQSSFKKKEFFYDLMLAFNTLNIIYFTIVHFISIIFLCSCLVVMCNSYFFSIRNCSKNLVICNGLKPANEENVAKSLTH